MTDGGTSGSELPAPSRSLTSLTGVRALLAEAGVTPRRALGQNFLVDANILRTLVDAAELIPGERVLEIGPGLGVLTEALLAAGARVTAIEKDARLHAHLHRRLADRADLDLRLADATDVDLPALFAGGIAKLVANRPYSVGSRLMMECFLTECGPRRLVVTVQKEVADRLAARPGSPDYGLLSVWAQLRYRPRLVKRIPSGCFWPAPDVTSAIVRLDRRDDDPLPAGGARRLKPVLARVFGQRRKKMGGVLGLDEAIRARWRAAGLDPDARPETWPPDQFARLVAEAGLLP